VKLKNLVSVENNAIEPNPNKEKMPSLTSKDGCWEMKIIYHRFCCRGYEDRFAIVREALRTEIGVRLAKYCADILHPQLKEEVQKVRF